MLDAEFSNDIALIINIAREAVVFGQVVETMLTCVVLNMNESKINYLPENITKTDKIMNIRGR